MGEMKEYILDPFSAKTTLPIPPPKMIPSTAQSVNAECKPPEISTGSLNRIRRTGCRANTKKARANKEYTLART
jgi:hypothetical protein